MRKASQKSWFNGLLSLLFALLLFFNANATGNNPSNSGSSQTYSETLNNIPVQVQYDKDKYYVSGFEESVNVHLRSVNRIQLNMESNADTRNFQVVADLTKLPLGTSEVPLTVRGLSSAVTAEIEPKTVTVTIEKRVTKKFDVEAQLSDNIEKEGYKVKNISVDPKTVEVTTGEETAKAIDKVIAPVSSAKQTIDTIKQTVNVQALDAKGQVLSIENPAPQVKVTVGLTAPTKDVPLNVSMTGTPPAGIAHYNYSLSTYQVRVSGPQSILDTLESIEVPVDISDIRKETKQSVTIPVNGEYVVTPDEVDVSLSPVYNQQQSSNTNETSGEPASSTTAGSGSQAVQPSTSSQVESNTSETTSEGSTVESTTAGSTENTENQVTKENQNG
ncbi:MAG: CdaR family protein [Enterococcus faecalis]